MSRHGRIFDKRRFVLKAEDRAKYTACVNGMKINIERGTNYLFPEDEGESCGKLDGKLDNKPTFTVRDVVKPPSVDYDTLEESCGEKGYATGGTMLYLGSNFSERSIPNLRADIGEKAISKLLISNKLRVPLKQTGLDYTAVDSLSILGRGEPSDVKIFKFINMESLWYVHFLGAYRPDIYNLGRCIESLYITDLPVTGRLLATLVSVKIKELISYNPEKVEYNFETNAAEIERDIREKLGSRYVGDPKFEEAIMLLLACEEDKERAEKEGSITEYDDSIRCTTFDTTSVDDKLFRYINARRLERLIIRDTVYWSDIKRFRMIQRLHVNELRSDINFKNLRSLSFNAFEGDVLFENGPPMSLEELIFREFIRLDSPINTHDVTVYDMSNRSYISKGIKRLIKYRSPGGMIINKDVDYFQLGFTDPILVISKGEIPQGLRMRDSNISGKRFKHSRSVVNEDVTRARPGY